jgi:Icc-related predicted phosphoesterase
MEWSYLEDSGIEWNGLKIWGSPWQPRFFDWAFNADEPDLERIWDKIPDDTDILVLHGPPHGYGDKASRVNAAGFEHTGSPSLLERIKAIKPKLAVAGHIHSGYGIYEIGETIFVNASLVNEKYIPTNAVITIEL